MPKRPRAVLTLIQGDKATYSGAVPKAVQGVWCLLSMPSLAPSRAVGIVARIDIALSHGGSIPVAAAVLDTKGSRFAIFLPIDSCAVHIELFGHTTPPAEIEVDCIGMSRGGAAWRIAIGHLPRLLSTTLRCLRWNPRGLFGRLRNELGYLGQTNRHITYPIWCALFDRWDTGVLEQLARSPDRTDWPDIDCLVFQTSPHNGPANATSDSVAASVGIAPGSIVTIGPANDDFSAALAGLRGTYVAVLQAGEIVAPHALALLAATAARQGHPAILYADDDSVMPNGDRYAPRFKQPPNRTAMLAADSCTGVWLIRRDAMTRFASGSSIWAETLRLDTWLRLYEQGLTAETHRVPFVLTHRRVDVETAPPSELAKIVSDHIVRTQLPAQVAVGRPLRVHFRAPPNAQQRVSIVIPSACRSPHVSHYIAAVLANTYYSNFEIIIAISSDASLDAKQSAMVAALTRDPRVRYLPIRAAAFNYAVVNNLAVQATESPLICLLNDDIAPLTPDWLAIMVGHLADPAVGIVGARLSYEDRSVQHAGVVMLPDGTGEHLLRFTPDREIDTQNDPLLSREVSCVTGACLLTRRALWDRMGGMNESYSSAFNDVDFCLRAGELGQGVVFAADAHLLHAESVTFGKHYGLQELDRNMADRLRVRARFPDIFENDPFHNQNLSLMRGNCRGLAVPPRIKPASYIIAKTA